GRLARREVEDDDRDAVAGVEERFPPKAFGAADVEDAKRPRQRFEQALEGSHSTATERLRNEKQRRARADASAHAQLASTRRSACHQIGSCSAAPTARPSATPRVPSSSPPTTI